MDFASDTLSLEKRGPVGFLWLDRPEKRNALIREMWTGLPRALEALAADEEVRAIVLAGRGKSFCVGLDLMAAGEAIDVKREKSSQAVANLRQLETTRAFQDGITALAACPLPVIAAIHGHCLGGGIDLATACDMRLASADATFSIRETRIGIVADVGTLQRLPKVVGAGHVAELAYTGKDIDAARAAEIGLVNDVAPDAEALFEAAEALALEIAANSPMAVRGTKFMLQQNEELTTDQSLLFNALFTLSTSLQSNDLQEAMRAFVAKRTPEFTGT
ncbi:MAG: enoyl-CoA hydratase-related protein [Myxococcota bacterium]